MRSSVRARLPLLVLWARAVELFPHVRLRAVCAEVIPSVLLRLVIQLLKLRQSVSPRWKVVSIVVSL